MFYLNYQQRPIGYHPPVHEVANPITGRSCINSTGTRAIAVGIVVVVLGVVTVLEGVARSEVRIQ